MGFLDFLTGGKKVDPVTIDNRNPQRLAVDKFLANYVSSNGAAYQPGKAYGGQFTAPLGGFERQGLDQFLSQYLNAPNVSPGQLNLQSFLQNTLNGGYDPNTSPYYQAYRDTANYNRDQAVKNTNADLGARGKYFSSEAVQKYGDINAQTSNALNLTNADLADKERNRSMAAVPYAAGLEQFLQQIPLNKASAATTIGAIPRTLEQSDLEAQYADFKRKQTEGAGVLNAASGVSTTPTAQGYPNPSLQSGDNSLMTLLSGVLGSSAGQGALGSIGAAGMGALSSVGGGLMSFLGPLLAFCWVAAELFGGWEETKTLDCALYIGELAPTWLRELYFARGQRFAAFIKDKPALKALIRPVFELFAFMGKKEREFQYGIA